MFLVQNVCCFLSIFFFTVFISMQFQKSMRGLLKIFVLGRIFPSRAPKGRQPFVTVHLQSPEA